jgi:hypothetical protein
MDTATTQQPVTKDAVWETWLAKGRRHDRATARNFNVVVGIVFPLVTAGILFYHFLG